MLRSGNSFQPYAGTDGIDVALDAGGTTWHFDVVLENAGGDLLVAECKRWASAVPQKEVAVIALTVERLRGETGRAVSGMLFAKTSVQPGALKHASYEGIEIIVAEADQPLPAFDIAVLKHDPQREQVLHNYLVSIVETVTLTESCDAFFTRPDGIRE